MIEQLKTVRAGLETATCYSMLGVDAHSVQIAITALTQIEAMVVEQEPVGAVLVNRESREGVMFYSPDMIPDPTAIKNRFELVTVFAAPVAQQPQAEQHTDDAAVDAFAVAMKEKLAQARAKGRGGWQTCPPDDLSRMLREHVEKGDPRDVANFCMFLWSLGAGIATPQQAEADREICPSCRNGDLYACTCTFPKTKPEPEALPIGVVVAIDASDPETGPDAIVALHRDVALGAKLYDQPPSRSAEIAELKESLRISLENYETQRKAAGQARAAMYDIHYALKDAGWHPGRTDDKLADIIRAKGERMRELEADSGIKMTPEEVEALRLTMSSAVLFNRANNVGDVRENVLTRFDQFFERVKDHIRPHQPDPEAVAEGLAQIIFEAINPGKVWTYQSTDVRNAYWQAGQAAKEFLK